MDTKIDVHPLTNKPTTAWKSLGQKLYKLKVKLPTKSVDNDKVRFVCMSDTHCLTHSIKFEIPDGDVFVHAGDFTNCGKPKELEEFNKWLGDLPHKHKIVVAGNHERTFDPALMKKLRDYYQLRPTGRENEIPTLGMQNDDSTQMDSVEVMKQLLNNCIYLEDSAIELYGIKIYGTPWQPEFCSMAFNLPRGQPCLDKWNLIPSDTEVLITHSPPVGHGDFTCSGINAGCVELLSTVQKRVKPRYHVYGHIHEGYGITSDGVTVFVNAATCDLRYLPVNEPIVFDVPLKSGFTKE